MASPTYTLITSNTLGSNTSSVTFSSIPNTYTDLILRYSVRDTALGSTNGSNLITTNNSAQYSRTDIRSDGATITSAGATGESYLFPNRNTINSAGNTTSTFSDVEIYITNYTSSSAKATGAFAINENNSSTAYIFTTAGLQVTTTPAINSITIAASSNFITGSSFYLYGIKNS